MQKSKISKNPINFSERTSRKLKSKKNERSEKCLDSKKTCIQNATRAKKHETRALTKSKKDRPVFLRRTQYTHGGSDVNLAEKLT